MGEHFMYRDLRRISKKDSYISSLAYCIMAEVHVISLSPELGSNVIMEIMLFSFSQPLWRHPT